MGEEPGLRNPNCFYFVVVLFFLWFSKVFHFVSGCFVVHFVSGFFLLLKCLIDCPWFLC